jgi:hypothetical protein
MSGITDRAEAAARSAGRGAQQSDWVDHAARIGLLAYGLVHVVVAWLALQLAFGDREGTPSSTGAVKELAQQPFGEVLVWAVGIGMLLLAAWQALEAATGHRRESGFTRVRKRLASGGKAVVYTAIGVSAVKVATGSGSSSKSGTDSWTAKVMDLPAGQLLVGAAGLAIMGIGGYLIHKAWTEKFKKDLDARGRSGSSGTAYIWLGKIGYTAKGVAFGIVGGLFLYAALTHDPKKSGGLDQALFEVLDQPFGPVLLCAIGLGLGCFGLFTLARARHLGD